MDFYRGNFSLKVDGKHIIAGVYILPQNMDIDIKMTKLLNECEPTRVSDCWPCQEAIEGRKVNGYIGLSCNIDKRSAILTIEDTQAKETLLEKEYQLVHSHGNTWIIKLNNE